MTGVSSRAGEITHFDGIKMSVFPTPICGEIARNRALRERKRRETEREREKESRRIPASSLFSRATLTAGVAFLRREEEERKCLAHDRRVLFLDVVQNVILERDFWREL